MAETTSKPGLVLDEREALELISFLTSAAEICLREPTYYGTFRLIDAASRLMGFMQGHELPITGEFVESFKADIDTHKTDMMWDREGYYDFLRRVAGPAAAELKRVTVLLDAEEPA